MAPVIPSVPTIPPLSHICLLFGASVHLARGLGRSAGGARGFGKGKPSPEASDEAAARRAAKSLRGKIVPCAACSGTGKKPCQFCQGTTLMVGFLGERVPCVPCQGKATLGRPCPECNGVGYFTP